MKTILKLLLALPVFFIASCTQESAIEDPVDESASELRGVDRKAAKQVERPFKLHLAGAGNQDGLANDQLCPGEKRQACPLLSYGTS